MANDQPDVKPADLAVTNQGVDMTATDTGVNPQAAEAVKANPALTTADQAVLAADPTPLQEATVAGSNVEPATGNPTPLQTAPVGLPIDASGLNVTTNQDVIDSFPKNDKGQVVIDEEGKVEGLKDSEQPSQPTGSDV